MKPRPLRTFSVTLVACALVLWSGYLQGRWTGRWAEPADFESAKSRLEGIPSVLGDWESHRELSLAQEVIEELECRGYVHREYKHRQSGTLVLAFWLVGPSGPTAAHVPEICYSSQNYSITEERSIVQLSDGRSSVWGTPIRKEDVDRGLFSVLYGWSVGHEWLAADSPRFEFGGQPLLYKVQVAAPDTMSGREFLNAFLDYWHASGR